MIRLLRLQDHSVPSPIELPAWAQTDDRAVDSVEAVLRPEFGVVEFGGLKSLHAENMNQSCERARVEYDNGER